MTSILLSDSIHPSMGSVNKHKRKYLCIQPIKELMQVTQAEQQLLLYWHKMSITVQWSRDTVKTCWWEVLLAILQPPRLCLNSDCCMILTRLMQYESRTGGDGCEWEGYETHFTREFLLRLGDWLAGMHPGLVSSHYEAQSHANTCRPCKLHTERSVEIWTRNRVAVRGQGHCCSSQTHQIGGVCTSLLVGYLASASLNKDCFDLMISGYRCR